MEDVVPKTSTSFHSNSPFDAFWLHDKLHSAIMLLPYLTL